LHPADLVEQRLRRHGPAEEAAQQLRRLVRLSGAQVVLVSGPVTVKLAEMRWDQRSSSL